MPVESPVDVGIVVALEREIELFLFHHPETSRQTGAHAEFLRTTVGDVEVGIAITGPGQERATLGTRALCDAMNPRWLISAGYGGALLPQLQVADAVVIEDVLTTTGEHLQLGGAYPFAKPDDEERFQQTINGHPLRVLCGRLFSADRIVATGRERQELAEKFAATVVDMETAAVVKVARDRHLPILAVRAVSDDFETDLPPEIEQFLGQEGAGKWGALGAALWKKPKLVKLLWQLKQNTLLASETLSVMLGYLISNLPSDDQPRTSLREEAD